MPTGRDGHWFTSTGHVTNDWRCPFCAFWISQLMCTPALFAWNVLGLKKLLFSNVVMEIVLRLLDSSILPNVWSLLDSWLLQVDCFVGLKKNSLKFSVHANPKLLTRSLLYLSPEIPCPPPGRQTWKETLKIFIVNDQAVNLTGTRPSSKLILLPCDILIAIKSKSWGCNVIIDTDQSTLKASVSWTAICSAQWYLRPWVSPCPGGGLSRTKCSGHRSVDLQALADSCRSFSSQEVLNHLGEGEDGTWRHVICAELSFESVSMLERMTCCTGLHWHATTEVSELKMFLTVTPNSQIGLEDLTAWEWAKPTNGYNISVAISG